MWFPRTCACWRPSHLKVQEAALTGESEPVEKDPSFLAQADLPIGDRRNMAYVGTVVTYGRGVGVAVSTGMQKELGKIAGLLGTVETGKTTLQEKLDKLGGCFLFIVETH